MSVELNAQTVKWFKIPDEQLDPLMSLAALTLSVKHRFHCCCERTGVLSCRLSLRLRAREGACAFFATLQALSLD